ncbi:MAG: hypothetical protein CVT88_07845 [Candidatus Altiarchaeales archaeon HGW-Altiarchaeales-1]|nr:MAG: hypothetical protein CVT88_07845 [Candidatus Altiarchaeales archaeon HGW-Altiarchaeales-1]
MLEQITKMGFEKYDDETYHSDFGMIEGRRCVLVFNPTMFTGERKSRNELIQKAKEYLEEENNALLKPKKSRNETKVRDRIDKNLEKMKVVKFVDYELKPTVVNVDGKEVKSFHIDILTNTDKVKENIKKAERTDGLWAIITNICSKEDDINGFTAAKLISSYRDKNQVEEAFKNVKSFINVHPFRVWTPTHVRAHYTICVLSYLLNVTVTNKLREYDIEDITSTHKAYEKLKRYEIGDIEVKGTKHAGKKIIDPNMISDNIIDLLKLFKCECLITNKYLKLIKIGGGSQ